MKIEPLSPMIFNPELRSTTQVEKPIPSFAHWVTSTVAETNHQLLAADHALQELANGQAVSLHHTMLALEEAKLSFQYLEQIRNRMMSAYQDILREQI